MKEPNVFAKTGVLPTAATTRKSPEAIWLSKEKMKNCLKALQVNRKQVRNAAIVYCFQLIEKLQNYPTSPIDVWVKTDCIVS